MRERDLAGPRMTAAADQRRRARRVMRRAKRPLAPALGGERPGERRERRRLQRLVLGQRRQQRRQALREHRLAGAGRSDEQQAVPAGGRDLQRALGLRLAAHVAQIGVAARRAPASAASSAGRRACPVSARRRRADRAPDGRRRRAPAPPRRPTPPAARTRGRRDARTAPSRAHRGSARSSPVSANSPANSYAASAGAGSCPLAARMPSAIGRSKRPDSFGRSAGARLTVTLRAGNSKRAFCNAARTRSRASRTSASGRPTMLHARQAAGEMHFDGDHRRVDARERAALNDGDRHRDDPKHESIDDRRRDCRSALVRSADRHRRDARLAPRVLRRGTRAPPPPPIGTGGPGPAAPLRPAICR